jgi:predicted ArsR family transcriptional regulator
MPTDQRARVASTVTSSPTPTVEATGSADAFDDDSFFSAVAAVTAAFGDTTRRQIYGYLRDRDGVTATEIAEQFKLHSNVARHHLDKLAAGGYLDVTLEHAPSGAGRPSKRYRRSGRIANLTVAPRPDELVVNLLVRALSLIEPATAMTMAEEVGEAYGKSLAAVMAPGEGQRSMHAAMLAVADALTAHGFAAHITHNTDADGIVRDFCPFGDTAIEYPVLCAVDRGMVRGMFAGLCGNEVAVSLSSKALGAEACESIAS